MWFMVAALALQGFSRYRAGQAQAEQLRQQKQMSLYRAKIAEADAVAAQRKTDFEQTRSALEAEQVVGKMRVAQGASGARTDVGTPLLVRSEQWAELELDSFLIGLEGRTRVSRFKSEAGMERVQASVYGRAAKNAKLAGTLGAVTGILGGLGTMSAMGMFDRSPVTMTPEGKATILRY